jgi:hypothetical protein
MASNTHANDMHYSSLLFTYSSTLLRSSTQVEGLHSGFNGSAVGFGSGSASNGLISAVRSTANILLRKWTGCMTPAKFYKSVSEPGGGVLSRLVRGSV